MPFDLKSTVAELGERIVHPEQTAFLDYWFSRSSAGRLPARRDLDPLDFPSLLPRIALIDVVSENGRLSFRYRLAGTEIVARARRDPTGKRFDELYSGDYLTQAQALYEQIVASGLPHLSERIYPVEDGREALHYYRLILPLASDGATVDMVALLIAVIDQRRLDDALEAFR
ncbi:PAS domain-containing protein [Algihabitans albus]|uniref:PAS domain-containing protein n=1 Tax=Algihabitans albus TaxID=2164067 RepID=UPI000E5CDE4C|nr:PAS domain-containing protein [Algihabitans albus]